MFCIILSSSARFWGYLVLLFIVGLGFLTHKATKGYTTAYMHYDLNKHIKSSMMFIHGFGSLILSLALPNNLINKIIFFANLYHENELWIALTIVVLLIFFLTFFGSVFTFACRKAGVNNTATS